VRQSQTLIDTYVRHAILGQPEDFWAWEDVYEIVHGPDGGAAFRLVVDLVRAVPDDRLEHVGAGPVEDLVVNFGPQLIEQIVVAAGKDPRFRKALASVWLVVEDLPEKVLERLQEATGGQIATSRQAELEAVELPLPADESPPAL
jgi:hypothetical protein